MGEGVEFQVVTSREPQRVGIVGVELSGVGSVSLSESLSELAFLCETAGGVVLGEFTQRLSHADPRTLIGSGKVREIAESAESLGLDLVVFDDELTPSQQRNLEHELGVRVIDRTGLILDIFAQRAQSAHAKTQVEMAQYQYLLPRLTGMWTHLERQKGGIGLRGPGEREIETDRRIVRGRITKLRQELERIDRQMATRRKGRKGVVRIAIVGYTNVGKSTLMNRLTQSDVLAENKLFATLDTTVRKFTIGSVPCLLSDTVGFIRKLPTQLVEAFKSTLDEVREADVLLHVIDLSHPHFEDQIVTVNETLRELGVSETPQVLVFNKIDAYAPYEDWDTDWLMDKPVGAFTLDELKQTWMGRDGAYTVFISASTGENMSELREVIGRVIRDELGMGEYVAY